MRATSTVPPRPMARRLRTRRPQSRRLHHHVNAVQGARTENICTINRNSSSNNNSSRRRSRRGRGRARRLRLRLRLPRARRSEVPREPARRLAVAGRGNDPGQGTPRPCWRRLCLASPRDQCSLFFAEGGFCRGGRGGQSVDEHA